MPRRYKHGALCFRASALDWAIVPSAISTDRNETIDAHWLQCPLTKASQRPLVERDGYGLTWEMLYGISRVIRALGKFAYLLRLILHSVALVYAWMRGCVMAWILLTALGPSGVGLCLYV